MKPLASCDEESETLFECQMLVLSKQNNPFRRVELHEWDTMRKKKNDVSPSYPCLDEDLRTTTLGVYQFKLG